MSTTISPDAAEKQKSLLGAAPGMPSDSRSPIAAAADFYPHGNATLIASETRAGRRKGHSTP